MVRAPRVTILVSGIQPRSVTWRTGLVTLVVKGPCQQGLGRIWKTPQPSDLGTHSWHWVCSHIGNITNVAVDSHLTCGHDGLPHRGGWTDLWWHRSGVGKLAWGCGGVARRCQTTLDKSNEHEQTHDRHDASHVW